MFISFWSEFKNCLFALFLVWMYYFCPEGWRKAAVFMRFMIKTVNPIAVMVSPTETHIQQNAIFLLNLKALQISWIFFLLSFLFVLFCVSLQYCIVSFFEMKALPWESKTFNFVNVKMNSFNFSKTFVPVLYWAEISKSIWPTLQKTTGISERNWVLFSILLSGEN